MLNQNIINAFRLQFQNNCISLLLDGYNSAYNGGSSFKENDENEITVKLVGLMKSNQNSKDYKIDIVREYYLDDTSTYSGAKHPDNSPRIDIRFMNWSTEDKLEFFMEAKNLAENDWVKSGGTKINASKLIKRYVETGINNFVSGKYKNGCLVGYVLEGNAIGVTRKLNDYLTKQKRTKEHLLHTQNHNFINNFSSHHLGTSCELLEHFFLELN